MIHHQILFSFNGVSSFHVGSSQEVWDNRSRDLGERNFKTWDHVMKMTPGNVPDYLAEKYDEDTISSFFRIANIFNQIFDENCAVIDSTGDNKSSDD